MKIQRYDLCIYGDGTHEFYKSDAGDYCQWEDVEKALAEKDAAYNLLAEASRALVIDAARPFTEGKRLGAVNGCFGCGKEGGIGRGYCAACRDLRC